VHVATHPALGALQRKARGADIASLTSARQVEIGRDVTPTLETVTTDTLETVITDRLVSGTLAVDNVLGGWYPI
jgi:hypothetical protein